MVFHVKGETWVDGVQKQGAEEDFGPYEWARNGRL